MSIFVVGIDPGLTTGIARLDLSTGELELLQCTPGLVLPLVRELCVGSDVLVLAVERFVVGPRAARSSTPKAGAVTRELIGALLSEGEHLADRVVLRSASEVKPWATDARLKAAGITQRGMPHALDAAKHALFAAVADCGIPDPLSRRAGAR